MQNAVNIEYAMGLAERTGLRKKLVALNHDSGTIGTMAWWLSKEPLRTLPVGTGPGQTAAQLGITQVAHETSDYLAYESITRAHTGQPNVLVSRPSAAGETAAWGWGFYARKGREGARGTGMTIRFLVEPTAREGTDFERSGDYVIFKNKAALRVIPESMTLSPAEFFRFIRSSNISPADRAIMEKLNRRVGYRIAATDAAEVLEIEEIVRDALKNPSDGANRTIIGQWVRSSNVHKDPALDTEAEKFYTRNVQEKDLLDLFIKRPDAVERPVLVAALHQMIRGPLYDRLTINALANLLLSRKAFWAHPEIFTTLFESSHALTALSVLTQIPDLGSEPQLLPPLAEYLKKSTLTYSDAQRVVQLILAQPGMLSHPEIFEAFIQGNHGYYAMRMAKKVDLAAHPELQLLAKLYIQDFDRNDYDASSFLREFMLQNGNERFPELFSTYARSSSHSNLIYAAGSMPDLAAHPVMLNALIESFNLHTDSYEHMRESLRKILCQPGLENFPEFWKTFVDKVDADQLIRSARFIERLPAKPVIVQALLRALDSTPEISGESLKSFAQNTLAQPGMENHPELFRWYLDQGHGPLLLQAIDKMNLQKYPAMVDVLEKIAAKLESRYDFERIFKILADQRFDGRDDVLGALDRQGAHRQVAQFLEREPKLRQAPALADAEERRTGIPKMIPRVAELATARVGDFVVIGGQRYLVRAARAPTLTRWVPGNSIVATYELSDGRRATFTVNETRRGGVEVDVKAHPGIAQPAISLRCAEVF